MADAQPSTETVTEPADHDRVAMLSIAKDGTADQVNPEIIGDKEAATEALQEQLETLAVSRVDAEHLDAEQAAEASGDEPPEAPQPEDYEAAQAEADDRAEAVVDALHEGAGDDGVEDDHDAV